MPDLSAAERAGDADRRFLTFRVGERRYALPAETVSEVVRVPPVARLPLSPTPLLGLANLRGSVLPVVSLRAALRRPGADGAFGGRAIVLGGSDPAVLVVDVVEGLVAPERSRIETQQASLSTEPGEILTGVFSIEAQEEVARILDIGQILSSSVGQKAGQARPRRSAAGATVSALAKTAENAADLQVLISFTVAGQEYALPVDSVQEIVALPAAVSVVPRADSVLLGVIAHRDGLLPLLSLRVLLGFAGTDGFSGREKVIVTPVNGVPIGLVADRTESIIRAHTTLIEPAPAILSARTGGEARIKAMFRAEGGRRLISILSPEQLFREEVVRRLGNNPGAAEAAPANGHAQSAEHVELLVFRLGEEAFGLPIAAVDEVARVPEKIARIPNAPEFLEGVVNLRGDVLPVIELRKRFGLPTHGVRTGRRLVIVRTEGYRAGLIVDSVSEVLRLPVDLIEATPELIGGTSPLVNGVANLAERGQIVLVLEPDALLSPSEHLLLDAFGAESAGQATS